ncbi:MAG: DUF2254 domain-containing protein [Alphaproteobacteria bacterium]|nr:DUF2254 domain-containing protein [Alphaproteobacteria bacterium]
MISLWHRRLEKIAQLMWVRAALFAVVGVAAALLAVQLAPFVPEDLPAKIGSDAVHQILNILASSMLAVTTFSLSVMVASYTSATNNVSPRATRLVREDPTTQNVLAVFLGSFLFSLVGIIALNTGYYSDRGRFVLFVVSIGVIGIIVFTMLRWIDHLTRLGRVGETIARVENATREAIAVRRKNPFLGGRRLDDEHRIAMKRGEPILPARIGYIAYIDMESIQSAAEELDAKVLVCALPGTFAHTSRPIAIVVSESFEAQEKGIASEPDAEENGACEKIQNAFEVTDERSFSQDPRFGLAVLAEIASRAVSPAINDAGTAIDVLGRAVRLLAPWVKREPDHDADAVSCPRVLVPELNIDEMFGDLFSPIARDGAKIFEVQIRLLKSLLALAELGDESARGAALRCARQALERSEPAMDLAHEKAQLRAVFEEIRQLVTPQ